jgi:hypothetical protein
MTEQDRQISEIIAEETSPATHFDPPAILSSRLPTRKPLQRLSGLFS